MFQSGMLTHGPVARLAWPSVRVKAFAENGANSTAMRFDEQNVDSMIGSLGWRASGQVMAGGLAVRPHGRLAWETETERARRDLRAALLSTPGSFTMPVYGTNRNWFSGEVGVEIEFSSKASGFLGYSRQFERNDGKFEAITAGVQIAI